MNKDIDYYLNLPYTIEIIPESNGGWYVGIKELPGCMTNAETPEDGLVEIRQLQREWLEMALEEGLAIPEPRPEEEYSGNFRLRVPRSLHRNLVEEADRQGVSLNQYINVALSKSIGSSPQIPKTSKPVEGSAPYWPGLSDAVRHILAEQGLTAEAGNIDERLFAEWVGQKLHELSTDYREGRFIEGLSGLQVLLNIFQQNAWRSAAVNLMVQITALLKQLIEDAMRQQQDTLQEAQLLSQVGQMIRQINRLNLRSVENRASYSRAAMRTELSLQTHLFGENVQVGEND